MLDFGTAWAGPQVGQVLADMGMEVIKVETRTRLDGSRMGRPIGSTDSAGGDEGKWPDLQPIFHGINRNKRGFTIDLKQPRSRPIIEELIKISDVVLDNSSPGTMADLKLDHPCLKIIKSDIISISLTGCGEDGPLRDVLVYAPLIAAHGGLQSLIGYPDSTTPMQVMFAYGDCNASMHGVFAVLSALWHREKTGEGQHIDLAESYAITNLLGEGVMDYVMNGRNKEPQGNRHPYMCPHNAYRCQGEDKWVTIAVKTDEEWSSLCRAMGHPELTTQEKFASTKNRLANQEELDSLITAWTINYTPIEVTNSLQAAEVAATPVMNIEEQYSDPHYEARGTYEMVEHPLVGAELIYAPPLKFSKTPGDIRRHAPSLGEDNDYVLCELLGFSPEESRQLQEDKVIY